MKVDDVNPIYKINEKTGKPQIVKEFPATAQSHGFNDIVDNYAGYATKTPLNNATLYQLDGSLNGLAGRFEWIIQDGNVTHLEEKQYEDIYKGEDIIYGIIEIHFLHSLTINAEKFLQSVQHQVAELGVKIQYCVSQEEVDEIR